MVKKGADFSTLFFVLLHCQSSNFVFIFMRYHSLLASICTICIAFALSGCAHEDSNLPFIQETIAAELNSTSIMPNQTPETHQTAHIDSNAVTNEFTRSAVISAWFGAQKRLTNEGLPNNTRQTKEGYWLGSRPDIDELEELHARNIRVILTASIVPRKELRMMKQKIEELGMTHIYTPFGSKFPHPNKFLPQIANIPPEQVFIHCEHGSDRTGAILAFILVKRHQWNLPEALFSVILPSLGDINALKHILNQHGYEIEQNKLNEIIGIYSAEKNGGYGGMKVREGGGNYYNLIHTLIKRAEQ